MQIVSDYSFAPKSRHGVIRVLDKEWRELAMKLSLGDLEPLNVSPPK